VPFCLLQCWRTWPAAKAIAAVARADTHSAAQRDWSSKSKLQQCRPFTPTTPWYWTMSYPLVSQLRCLRLQTTASSSAHKLPQSLQASCCKPLLLTHHVTVPYIHSLPVPDNAPTLSVVSPKRNQVICAHHKCMSYFALGSCQNQLVNTTLTFCTSVPAVSASQLL
jgi:hypothetical protein